MGQDQDRRPRARGNGGTINLSSPGKSKAWVRLLGTSAVPGSRGTTRLGDPGRYLFGEDAGQQGTGPGSGFALSEYGNQGFTQAAVLGTGETGFPDLWASPATGTGMTGLGLTQLATGNLGIGPPSALGATVFGGPGQWARPTRGTGISSISFAQPGMGN